MTKKKIPQTIEECNAELERTQKLLTPKAWQTELAALTAENEAEYAKLKVQREEVVELQKVRRYVDIALQADAPQKTKTKHHDIGR